jgi:hypothetical protein
MRTSKYINNLRFLRNRVKNGDFLTKLCKKREFFDGNALKIVNMFNLTNNRIWEFPYWIFKVEIGRINTT